MFFKKWTGIFAFLLFERSKCFLLQASFTHSQTFIQLFYSKPKSFDKANQGLESRYSKILMGCLTNSRQYGYLLNHSHHSVDLCPLCLWRLLFFSRWKPFTTS